MLPPYGKILKAYQDLGIIPNYHVYVFVGKDSYKQARNFIATQVCLCLPYDRDILDYDWPIHDVKLLVIDTGGQTYQQLERIVGILLNNGAKSVFLQTNLTAPLQKED